MQRRRRGTIPVRTQRPFDESSWNFSFSPFRTWQQGRIHSDAIVWHILSIFRSENMELARRPQFPTQGWLDRWESRSSVIDLQTTLVRWKISERFQMLISPPLCHHSRWKGMHTYLLSQIDLQPSPIFFFTFSFNLQSMFCAVGKINWTILKKHLLFIWIIYRGLIRIEKMKSKINK